MAIAVLYGAIHETHGEHFLLFGKSQDFDPDESGRKARRRTHCSVVVCAFAQEN